MRHVGRDVEEVARLGGELLLEALAERHPGGAAEDVDRRLVASVQVRLPAAAGRDPDPMEADGVRLRALPGDAADDLEPLSACARLAAADDDTRLPVHGRSL